MTLIADGRTKREIAATLLISVGTAKDHVDQISRKIGLASRAPVAGRWRSKLCA